MTRTAAVIVSEEEGTNRSRLAVVAGADLAVGPVSRTIGVDAAVVQEEREGQEEARAAAVPEQGARLPLARCIITIRPVSLPSSASSISNPLRRLRAVARSTITTIRSANSTPCCPVRRRRAAGPRKLTSSRPLRPVPQPCAARFRTTVHPRLGRSPRIRMIRSSPPVS